MSELSPIEQPVIDKVQLYGASLVRAAIGLETSQLGSMLLKRGSGKSEVVISTGASVLVAEAKDQFGIQQIFFPDLVIEKIEEIEESVD